MLRINEYELSKHLEATKNDVHETMVIVEPDETTHVILLDTESDDANKVIGCVNDKDKLVPAGSVVYIYGSDGMTSVGATDGSPNDYLAIWKVVQLYWLAVLRSI